MNMINQDGFFDITLTAQKLPEELTALFEEGGWTRKGHFRSVAPVAGDGYRKTFAETHLFSSKGSDNKIRNLGFIVGYGGTVRSYSQAPMISKDTTLGKLDTIDGGQGKKFRTQVFPIYPQSVIIYDADGNVITNIDQPYAIDGEKGEITFLTPVQGDLYCTYALTDNAPELVKRVYFFTYEAYSATKLITRADPESTLVDKTGGIFTFPAMKEHTRIKEFSYTVYDGTTDALINQQEYTVDHEKGEISFANTEPTSLWAEYEIEYIADSQGNYGDITVNPFDPKVPKQLVAAPYEAFKFIFPSIPTAVSFIPTNELGLGWARDAQVYYWGNITKDRIVSYFRFDPAPDATVPYFAPLYAGRLSTIGKAPRSNHVLIGGCRAEDEITYVPGIQLGRSVVDYGVNTSNGNSSVLLQSSVGGALYQKYYLAFITHSADIDPTGEGQFNPSAYSNRSHIAPMYIVHPADGYVGRLDEVYAIHPKNISQLDELVVEETSNVEHIGTGDGTRVMYHTFHTPIVDEDLEIKFVGDDCTILTMEDYVEENPGAGQFTLTPDKQVIFGEAVRVDVQIYMTYNYKQTYRFTMADTPRTPYRLANMTPYSPIGLGFLKENIREEELTE